MGLSICPVSWLGSSKSVLLTSMLWLISHMQAVPRTREGSQVVLIPELLLRLAARAPCGAERLIFAPVARSASMAALEAGQFLWVNADNDDRNELRIIPRSASGAFCWHHSNTTMPRQAVFAARWVRLQATTGSESIDQAGSNIHNERGNDLEAQRHASSTTILDSGQHGFARAGHGGNWHHSGDQGNRRLEGRGARKRSGSLPQRSGLWRRALECETGTDAGARSINLGYHFPTAIQSIKRPYRPEFPTVQQSCPSGGDDGVHPHRDLAALQRGAGQ
jgi:hypothetical protein